LTGTATGGIWPSSARSAVLSTCGTDSAGARAVTERDIQHALYLSLARRERGRFLIVPNFTPPGWWESDLWLCRASGYTVEHEIKRSRRDFEADGQKAREWLTVSGDELRARREHKHELLASGDNRGPGQFYFVAPKGLLAADEVPAWAGLKLVYDHVVSVEKQAPKLHRAKVTDEALDAACRSTYHRFWKLWLQQYRRLHRDPQWERFAR